MKKYVISLFIGIMLLGFGCCYLVFEVMSFNQVELPDKFKETSSRNYEYTLKENETYNVINYNDGKVRVIIDNNLENILDIKVTYHNFYDNVTVYKNSYTENVMGKSIYRLYFSEQTRNPLVTMKQIYEIVKEMVKNKEFYNGLENYASPWLEIKINEKNIDQLQINGVASESFITSQKQNKIAES